MAMGTIKYMIICSHLGKILEKQIRDTYSSDQELKEA
jgi:hypothetical protein